MTQISPELQAQINAMRVEYEQIIVNISHQCADKAIVIAAQAMRIKELEAHCEPKPEPTPAAAS